MAYSATPAAAPMAAAAQKVAVVARPRTLGSWRMMTPAPRKSMPVAIAPGAAPVPPMASSAAIAATTLEAAAAANGFRAPSSAARPAEAALVP